MELLKVHNLTKVFGDSSNKVIALENVSLSVKKGEFLAIVGSSGSGKTTLLNILGGLDKPTSGEVKIQDTNIALLCDDEATVFRRQNIGFIFQQYNLIPMLSVMENIMLPTHLDNKQVDKEYLEEVVTVLGLSGLEDRLPNTLSGGQQQRVAIARALAIKPKYILADEPTGNLDTKNSLKIIELLKTSNKVLNQTIIIITHDMEIAEMADRTIRIEDGKVTNESL